MRRSRFISEESTPTDPELATLKANLKVLTPIRAHRLHTSERHWRRAKQSLAEIQRRIDEKEVQLQQRREEHLQRRVALAAEHQSRSISHETLKDWMGKEKQLLRDLDDINRELNELHLALEQQQEKVQQAKQQVDILQLENERLQIFTHELEEAT
ncbi:hypothetical protein QCD60_24565 [Pokkaliibacter sp. MBI-7]|uniref:hypothetical protein n=1 Tax=Pokkaliibacter sp. MBI-7 TaxID=3040600 RepID=UPI00244941B2|nr:hypothetical protein [Pokkaliibacter sp. MBI-7]MDH2435704.1 hypothetical protein [Pokkaliibacter sp. MBI-7]